MTRYMDIVEQWERERQHPGTDTIDGHAVKEILWQTPKVVVFRDPDGRVWRRVHAWNLTWPVEVGNYGKTFRK